MPLLTPSLASDICLKRLASSPGIPLATIGRELGQLQGDRRPTPGDTKP